ncbi:MAG: biotin--[acetyl-CoA-carboxylase] ligase [Candidatus Aminicenantes bacterium]|jgi:BirA family biotin operon repressor/biotin-[acetyl-CoA-carboxylase] ligase
MYKFPDFLYVIPLDQCDSTNNYIKTNHENLQDKLPVLVTSSMQTAGRGREKRNWVSTKGKGLYSSFGFNLENRQNLNLLPLIAGISVIDTLKKITGIELGLKWPNDILYKNKKIAGILIENIITASDIFCITGIGVNLNHTTADFPGELQEKAISLKMITGLNTSAEQITPVLAALLFQWLERLKTGGTKEIIQTANRYSAFLKNKNISFHHAVDNKIISGIFKAINHDGGLILENKQGSTTIYYSGEIV